MKIAFAFAALSLAITVPAAAVTLTFDDLDVTDDVQIETYGGFNFANFFAKNVTDFYPSGYVNGVHSLTNVAYNGDGRHASAITSIDPVSMVATPFSLTSAYIAAAWNDGLTVQVVGSLAGVQIFTQSFVVDTQKSTFAIFNPALIDSVVFTSTGGVHHPGYNAGTGTELSLDDLTINGTVPGGAPNAVPEPASWALMLAGFGFVGAATRRRGTRAVAA